MIMERAPCSQCWKFTNRNLFWPVPCFTFQFNIINFLKNVYSVGSYVVFHRCTPQNFWHAKSFGTVLEMCTIQNEIRILSVSYSFPKGFGTQNLVNNLFINC